MGEMYITTMILAMLVGVIFIYSLYCLIDLMVFKAKIVATGGNGTVKHINLYRLLLRLKGGKGLARVPDMLFRISIALKIDSIITAIALIATIILIGITATLSVFNSTTSAIIINNRNIIQNKFVEDNWVDEKDDARHENSSDSSEGSEDDADSTNDTDDADDTDESFNGSGGHF